MNAFRTDPSRTYLENPTGQADAVYDSERRYMRRMNRRVRKLRRKKFFKKVRAFFRGLK